VEGNGKGDRMGDSPVGEEKRKRSRFLDPNRILIVYNTQEDKPINNNNINLIYNSFLTVASTIISGT
jgi:hypothetical protein